MRGARIHAVGAAPRLDEIDEPRAGAGEALLEVRAVAFNPVDLAIATGKHYAGQPPLPYIVGCEGAGRVLEAETVTPGAAVYVFGAGVGTVRDGTLAERVVIPEEALTPLPEGVDERLAVACGIPGVAGWTPVTRRADVGADDIVLVLGATGSVGRTALQAARVRGVRRVVAAGRDREALELARELGADATVQLGATADLAAAFKEACGDTGPTVVIDPLWGEPAAAAVHVAARGARIVNIGAAAGPETTLASADVRGKQLQLTGYSNFALTREELDESYLELLGHAVAGRVRMEFESLPLERVGDAWARTASGGERVVVVLPAA